MTKSHNNRQSGYALIVVIIFTAALATLIAAIYFFLGIDRDLTKMMGTEKSSYHTLISLLKLERSNFVNKLESGELNGQAVSSDKAPCATTNLGSGDFTCINHKIGAKSYTTFAQPIYPILQLENLTLTRKRQDLTSLEIYSFPSLERYPVFRMLVDIMPVNIFQYDLFDPNTISIEASKNFQISGQIYTGGDLKITASANTVFEYPPYVVGETTVNDDICSDSNLVKLKQDGDKSSAASNFFAKCSASVTEQLQKIAESTIKTEGFTKLKSQSEVIGIGGEQWISADIRIRATIAGDQMTFIAVDTNGSPDNLGTAIINACKNQGKSALVGKINSFFDIWDDQTVSFADIDLSSLLSCLDAGLASDISADGISVFFYGGSPSLYPRLNGESLPFTYPDCRKISFVTDKKVFLRGDFNQYPQNTSQQKKGLPAVAIMGETINLLSIDYRETAPADITSSSCYVPGRIYDSEANVENWFGCSDGPQRAKKTIINASFLSFKGPSRTLTDYFVMHESWRNVELKHAGSMINYSITPPKYPLSMYDHGPRFKKDSTKLSTYECTKHPATLLETITTTSLSGKAKLWD